MFGTLKSVMAEYWVYIMTNVTGMLYTGVTNNIWRRVSEHKAKSVPGFTSRYNLTKLVYCESTSDVYATIAREKHIKGWVRSKKIALINSMNPAWKDLSREWSENEPVTGGRDPSLRSG
jgi:putative endonuclease